MKITTSKGMVLDSEGGMCKHLNGWVKNKKLDDVIVMLATDPKTDSKEYVILKDNELEYASQSFEAIAAHLDMMGLDRQFKEVGR